MLRFLLVGAGATALQYVILVTLVQTHRTTPLIASTIGFAASAAFNYLANRSFTFRSRGRHRASVPRFAVVSLVGLALNAVVLGLFHEGLHIHYLAAQVVATSVTLAWNFWFNRHWTFAQ